MRKSHLVLAAAFLLFVAAASTPRCSAATVQGTAYEWWTLRPLENVIIDINTTPAQQVIATDGSYSLSLPSGSYTLSAKYKIQNLVIYETQENITIPENAENRIFTLDLIMFPAEEGQEFYENENIDPSNVEDTGATTSSSLIFYTALVAVIGIVVILVAVYLGRLVREVKEIPLGPGAYGPSAALPDDLKEVVDVINQSGGRTTQVEIREKIPYSEAKISLMLDDLEDRGLIRKIKKGRGNIIISTTEKSQRPVEKSEQPAKSEPSNDTHASDEM